MLILRGVRRGVSCRGSGGGSDACLPEACLHRGGLDLTDGSVEPGNREVHAVCLSTISMCICMCDFVIIVVHHEM